MILFDFQQNALDSAIDFFTHGGRSLINQMPTGTGKSIVFKAFIEWALNIQPRPIYFLTHSKLLMRQFSEHLTEIGIRHGIIAPGFPLVRYRVQVISVQSLATRYHLLDEPGFLLFEEAHHSTTNTFKKPLDYWKSAKLFGQSATPRRPDGTPLSMYEHMIVSPQVKWFISEGYLANYDYFIPEELDTSKFHHSMGDFSREDLKKIRISSFVKSYEDYGKNKPGISFGVDIEDAEKIAGIFSAAGYPMKAVHSKMKDDLHAAIMNNKLISSCDAIGEGVDIRGVSVEIDARPTESMVIKRQHTGRVLRADWAKGHDLSTKSGRLAAIAESGKKAIILDFVSNYTRHGKPDDDYEWSLIVPRKKEKEESLYKRCPQCQRPVIKFDMICPACGYVFMKRATIREPIQEKDGRLININSANKADINRLVLAIARGARKIEKAYSIGQSMGADRATVDKIWREYLRNA